MASIAHHAGDDRRGEARQCREERHQCHKETGQHAADHGSMSIRSVCETGRRAWREQNLPARRGRFLNADQPPPACTVSGFAGSARDPSPPGPNSPICAIRMAGSRSCVSQRRPATGTGPGRDDRHPSSAPGPGVPGTNPWRRAWICRQTMAQLGHACRNKAPDAVAAAPPNPDTNPRQAPPATSSCAGTAFHDSARSDRPCAPFSLPSCFSRPATSS